MLWFLRGFGAVCALPLAWMILHSLKAQLSKKKRAWTCIHAVISASVIAYTVSELALGWMHLSQLTRIFCASCWGLLSLGCIISAILDAFAAPDKSYISLRHFNHDFGSLLLSLFTALLPLFPAYLYMIL